MQGKFKDGEPEGANYLYDEVKKDILASESKKTTADQMFQIKLMCLWGFTRDQIDYINKVKNIRDLDFARICAIMLGKEKYKQFLQQNLNNSFIYEDIIQELADEIIRQRLPDFSFDEIKVLNERNRSLNERLALHRDYLNLLREQAQTTSIVTGRETSAVEEISALKKELEDKKQIIRELEEQLSKAQEKEASVIYKDVPVVDQKLKEDTMKLLVLTDTLIAAQEEHFKTLFNTLRTMDQSIRSIPTDKGNNRKGIFASLFASEDTKGTNTNKEEVTSDRSDIDNFIDELMSDDRFTENQYKVIYHFLNKIPLEEIRKIANPEFDDVRLRFIAEFYAKKHMVDFDFSKVVGISPKDTKYDEVAPEEEDPDETITIATGDDDD